MISTINPSITSMNLKLQTRDSKLDQLKNEIQLTPEKVNIGKENQDLI